MTNHGNVNGSGENVGGIVGSVEGDIDGTSNDTIKSLAICTISNATNHGNVTGSWGVGGIVATIIGYVENSTINTVTNHGNVSGDDYVGGVVGWSSGDSKVRTSCNLGSVVGVNNTGGVVGINHATIIDTYNLGSVSGNDAVGGLVGNNTGTVNTSYSAGAVFGSGSTVGGLIGYNTGEVTDSYWDKRTSGIITSAGGTGKNTTAMMRAIMYRLVGWDFESIWIIRHDLSYPFFQKDYRNEEPMANDDSYKVPADGVLSRATDGVLVNDEDLDESTYPSQGGYNLSVVLFDDRSAYGAVVDMSSDGSFTYDPTSSATFVALQEGEFIVDEFTYTVSDGLDVTSATVTINVTGVNDAPQAQDDEDTIDEDTILYVTAPGLLSNDFDTDSSDSLVIAMANQTITTGYGAIMTLDTDGSYSYDPTGSATLQALADGESILDDFTYAVTDGNGGWDTATVTINVTGVNDGPVAGDDLFEILEDSQANDLEIMTNDVDPDHDPLSIIAVTQGAHGTVIITGDGSGLSYEPDPDFAGTDTFSYDISDGQGGEDTGTVMIIVNNTNDAPVIKTEALELGIVGELFTFPLEVSNIDGDELNWSMTSNAHWLQVNDTTGRLIGHPEQVGVFWVNVTVTDGQDGTDQVNLTLVAMRDLDGDGRPDPFDNDLDGDGVTNGEDAFPEDLWESVDTDGDKIGNNADEDDDGDGWNDSLERAFGTDPLDDSSVPVDTDNDGTPDIWDGDDDGDGWADALEIMLGINPLNDSAVPVDTDDDGIPDIWDDDDDNDGWADVIETMLGVNPLDDSAVPLDTDGDGTPDIWDDDDDGDGWSDIVENLTGTGNKNASSMPLDTDDDGIPDGLDVDVQGQEDQTTETPTWAYLTLVTTIALGVSVVIIWKKPRA